MHVYEGSYDFFLEILWVQVTVHLCEFCLRFTSDD